MTKKLLYYSGLVILPFIGIGFDYLFILIREIGTQASTINPQLIFFAVANILMISMIVWLSVHIQKFPLSKIFAVIVLIAGFYIVCIPFLYSTGLVPRNFLGLFGDIGKYKPLAGAFLFIVGLINILPRKKESHT